MRSATAALMLVAVAAATAAAQSKRYPPEPVDKDKEKAEHSKVWESATNPAREPYRALIVQSKQAIEARTPDELAAAVKLLDDAVALLPHEPDAYRWRGEAEFLLSDWAKCAADLKAAVDQAPRARREDSREATELQLRLGNCQARAGKLADAERTLADAAAAGNGNGEMLMRLGEVRIALGKLDEAIAALQAALELPDVAQAQTRFLLASAYDRARRPAEAIEEARRGAGFDREFSSLLNPQLPFIGTGEASYLLGLAYAAQESPRAEYALVHFRAFVKAAPDSPWRKRAEDHLRELRAATFPDAVERKPGGVAALDLDAATAVVRRSMAPMRACMAKIPFVVVEVNFTRSGPAAATKGPVPRRYRIAPPPDGVTVRQTKQAEATPRGDIDAAIRCVEPLASRLALPAVKERDAWYQIGFSVVAP